ncbi:MAG: HEPN domain-containing protein [Cyclobacteriaceae bacterium]|nr:HEPN domain-containing protein [Cyclobacteriaceae bacterium]
MDKDLNISKLIKYWLDASDDDFDTMTAMFDSKRYSWSLFLGHLMIEKLLKAYFVKVNAEYPPNIHNLLRLAEKAGLELTEEKKEQLVTITAFNINARYDDYKLSFKNKCTPEFTAAWIDKLNELRPWIRALIEH